MGRNLFKSRSAIGGKPLTGSCRANTPRDPDLILLRDFQPIAIERPLFVQWMIDLAAVVSIVALSCLTSMAIVASGFILFFVKLS